MIASKNTWKGWFKATFMGSYGGKEEDKKVKEIDNKI